MQAFLGVIDMCRSDMYLHPHTRYYMRELRLVAYNQVCHHHVVLHSTWQTKQARRQAGSGKGSSMSREQLLLAGAQLRDGWCLEVGTYGCI